MSTAADVYRSESNTERFGRVIHYSIRVGDVRFTAERMVGLDTDYTVSTTVGRCGMSFVFSVAKIKGGRGVAARLAAVADQLAGSPVVANPHRVDLCCDRAACDPYRAEIL